MCKDFKETPKFCRDVSAYPECLTKPEIKCRLKENLRTYADHYIPPPAPIKVKLI